MAFGGLELAAGQTLAQLHHGRCRLGDVHVHRIDLLHDGQRRGSALADQRAFRHQRTADAAADGRGHRRIRQVDLGRLQVGTGHVDVGSRLALGRDGVVIVQLADGAGLHQRRVAGHLLGGQLLGRLGAHQRSLGTVVGGAQRGRVDLEQHLAGLHVTAFLEEALLQDAGGTGADLGHARRFDPARQVLGQADGRDLGLDHADGQGRRRAAAGRLLLAALLAGGHGGQRDAGHDSLDDHARDTGLAFLAAVLPRKRCLIHGHVRRTKVPERAAATADPCRGRMKRRGGRSAEGLPGAPNWRVPWVWPAACPAAWPVPGHREQGLDGAATKVVAELGRAMRPSRPGAGTDGFRHTGTQGRITDPGGRPE